MTVRLREVGSVLAALGVTAVYLVYGAIIGFFLFMEIEYSFFWLPLFRPMFYLPGIIVVIYLYLFKKKRGLFLESLAFLLALLLAVLLTLELIIYI